MCLAVPGKVIEITVTEPMKMGKVNFGGVIKEICLEWLPEVEIGNWVIAHTGFALNIIDEKDAELTLRDLKAMGDI